MKKQIMLIRIFLIFLSVFSLTGTVRGGDEITVAVVGPMSGNGTENGNAMIKGITLGLEQFRKQGFFGARDIRLQVFDDQNKKDLAQKIAEDIAAQGKAVLVLGHYYSTASIDAGKVYKKYGIPAITASATADDVVKDNEWYFQLVPNNSFQGDFIACYISRILKKKSATLIFDKDSYGMSLASSFEKTAQRLSVDIRLKWGFDNSDAHWEEKWEAALEDLKKMKDPGMIFLAVHVPEGLKILSSLKYPGSKFDIIGPDAFGGTAFLKGLQEYPMEKAIPGYFSDDLYAITPFIIDLASAKAQDFRNDYFIRYQEEPSWVAAGYYDAILMSLTAIREAGMQEGSIAEKRVRIRDFLAGINSYEKSLEGVNGNLFFDTNRGVVRPLAMGIYKNHVLVSAPAQYRLVTDVQNINDMMENILEGRIIRIGDHFMRQTRVVYTGIDINEISDLDLVSQSYTVDFYLWFRYHGDFDHASIEFVNAENPIELNPEKQTLKISNDIVRKVMEEKTGEFTTQTYRIRAGFQSDFDFHDYPFDKQSLNIRFRHSHETRDTLIYIPDVMGMRHFRSSDGQENGDFSAIPGWETDSESYFQDVVSNNSTLGVPKFFGSNQIIRYSQFNAEVRVRRQIVGFLFKDIFSVFIMLMTLYIMYFISNERFELRLSMGMGVLMTNAFLHMDVSSALQAGYILVIDYAFFMVYGLSTLSIVFSLMGNRMYISGKEKQAHTLDIAGRIVHPLIIFAVCAVIAFRYLL